MKIINLFLICLLLLNCKNKVKSKVKIPVSSVKVKKAPKFNLGDFYLEINADREDFDISNIQTDTIKIKKTLYKNIDGAVLKPKANIEILSISEDIFLGVKQYTVDDNPATSLNLNLKKEVRKSERINYTFDNVEKFKKWLLNNHFLKIKEESINFQKNFFTKLLKNKVQYLECCEEYISKANDFLESDKNNLNNFEELNLEPFIKKRILIINYIHNLDQKEKVIIYDSL